MQDKIDAMFVNENIIRIYSLIVHSYHDTQDKCILIEVL